MIRIHRATPCLWYMPQSKPICIWVSEFLRNSWDH